MCLPKPAEHFGTSGVTRELNLGDEISLTRRVFWPTRTFANATCQTPPRRVEACGAPSSTSLCINTIRTLAMDAVQKANSGHPGTPMALAPVAYTLWQEALRYDCDDPKWPNRDRFVLSNGHASMMLYALLHLAHVRDPEEGGRPAVSLDDIKQFRQLGSRCPGHPEHGVTPGVETTTGPLGQGCGNSVGMAIGGRFLASRFNRPDFPVFDFNVYTFCGDGDLMEGVASEAASLAGHLQLSNLCWIYDNNHITIDGSTAITFTENVAARFRAYRWNVTHVADANDTQAMADALANFKSTSDRPTLIIVDSHIAYGSPHKQDTSAAHGEPLGEEEVKLTKRVYGWPEDAKFLVPDGVYEQFSQGIGERGRLLHREWNEKFAEYCRRYPELGSRLHAIWQHALPPRWDADLPSFPADPKGLATRDSSGKVLNAIAQNYPWLIGGAADLNASTKTALKFDSAGDFEPAEYTGRNLHFGIREHAMGAILNGLTSRRLARIWFELFDLLRLHAAADAAGGDDGFAGHLRVHPRFNRPRRRRPDAPAGGAADRAALGS